MLAEGAVPGDLHDQPGGIAFLFHARDKGVAKIVDPAVDAGALARVLPHRLDRIDRPALAMTLAGTLSKNPPLELVSALWFSRVLTVFSFEPIFMVKLVCLDELDTDEFPYKLKACEKSQT